MIKDYFNRYQYFISDNTHLIVPNIEIPIKNTDKYIYFKEGIDRMDKLSFQHYNTPLFGWLIMLANPNIGGLEFNIPNNTLFRIPYPLINSLQDYKKNVELYKLYYGE